MFMLYMYCIIMIDIIHWQVGAVGVMILSSSVVLWAVTVTACDATVSYWVVAVTAPLCLAVSSIHTLRI